MANSTMRAFGRDVSISVVATAVVLGLAFGNNVAIARLGGPDARGLYALGVAALALAWPIASLGLPGSLVFLLGRGADESRVAGLAVLRTATLAVACAAGVGVYLAVAPWPSGRALSFLFTAMVLPASVGFELIRNRYLGQRRALAFNGALIGLTGFLLILNLITLPMGQEYVLINWAASFWVVTLLFFAVRLARGPALAWPTPALRQEARAFGLRSAAVRLSEAALMRLDYLVIAPWLTLDELGIYAIADQLALLLASVGLQAGRMMFAHSAADQGGAQARAVMTRAQTFLSALTLAIIAAAAASFGWVIPAVFSDAFTPAYEPLLWLLPGTFFRSLHAPLAAYLRGQGRQDPVVVAGVVATAVLVGGCVGLVSIMGTSGAAVSKSAALAIQLALTWWAYRRIVGRDTIHTS